MGRTVILASSSHARRELLQRYLGGTLNVYIPHGEIEAPRSASFKKACKHAIIAALAKALSTVESRRVKANYIVAADTLVYIDGKVLGKPRTEDEARNYLLLLRGKWHLVITGLAVLGIAKRAVALDYVVTHVKMRNYNDAELEAYLASGEWRGKAGGYAIQGRGALLVEAIAGCFYNVIGLPLSRLYELVVKSGLGFEEWWDRSISSED